MQTSSPSGYTPIKKSGGISTKGRSSARQAAAPPQRQQQQQQPNPSLVNSRIVQLRKSQDDLFQELEHARSKYMYVYMYVGLTLALVFESFAHTCLHVNGCLFLYVW